MREGNKEMRSKSGQVHQLHHHFINEVLLDGVCIGNELISNILCYRKKRLFVPCGSHCMILSMIL